MKSLRQACVTEERKEERNKEGKKEGWRAASSDDAEDVGPSQRLCADKASSSLIIENGISRSIVVRECPQGARSGGSQ